jgi:uncharacterized LabA/DUF88 family protein
MGLCYAKISSKLIGPARHWLATRYYIGALQQSWNPVNYANQRRFLSLIQNDDARITVHLGRLERRSQANPLAEALLHLVDDPDIPAEAKFRNQLRALARGHARVETLKEKAVDIMLALDMVEMGRTSRYDVAYLLSADGDFTPVVEIVRQQHGKRVYCASPGFSSALNGVANAFIKLEKDWFDDCYR